MATPTVGTVNYATEYQAALERTFSTSLYFGDLWAARKPEVSFVNSHTVEIPKLKVGGRADGNRTSIGSFSQNFGTAFDSFTLSNHRTWQTLVHPRDIAETRGAASIQNITVTMNQTQKLPEMDAEMMNSLFTNGNTTKITTKLTTTTVLSQFDALMDKMDEAEVPMAGRILYVDTYTKTLLDQAIAIVRQNGAKVVDRGIDRLDEVTIKSVPTSRMKSAYTLSATDGFSASSTAKDVNMILVHPICVIPCLNYEFAQLGAPSALSQGKYVYFEESFEDVFVYEALKAALQIVYYSAT